MDDYVKYRLDTAKERIDAANDLIETGHYKDSINRTYYAIFAAMRAVLATRKVDFSKHSGVIGYFRKEFIKTGIFDVKYSDYIKEASFFRNDCDYQDFVIVSKEEAINQLNHAEELYNAAKDYLNSI